MEQHKKPLFRNGIHILCTQFCSTMGGTMNQEVNLIKGFPWIFLYKDLAFLGIKRSSPFKLEMTKM